MSNNNTINIYRTFLIDSPKSTSGEPIDNIFINDLNVDTINALSGDNINISGNLIPTIDGQYYLGTNIKRWRELNTLSGYSSFWSAQTATINSFSGDTINLGYDDISMEFRILDKNTSILKDDNLNGGIY